jgi:N4-gp56 family major capsid protein
MSVVQFIPEVWSAQLLSSLKKAEVFAGLCNRQYEGEISQAGDTVHITSISRPTVAAYVKDSTVIAPETLTDAQKSLIIDKAYYFAFEVDDIDKRQAAAGGALMAEAAQEAAYALADAADLIIIAAMEAGVSSVTPDNAYPATSRATSALCVEGILDIKTKLDEANVPQQGRWLVIAPWIQNRLMLDTRYITIDSLTGGSGFRNGQVGRIMGFDVILSNNLTLSDTVNDSTVIAGYPGAVTFAEQISKVEAYRPQGSFSDALKGLHLYGVKVVRPTGLVTSIYSQT